MKNKYLPHKIHEGNQSSSKLAHPVRTTDSTALNHHRPYQILHCCKTCDMCDRQACGAMDAIACEFHSSPRVLNDDHKLYNAASQSLAHSNLQNIIALFQFLVPTLQHSELDENYLEIWIYNNLFRPVAHLHRNLHLWVLKQIKNNS